MTQETFFGNPKPGCYFSEISSIGKKNIVWLRCSRIGEVSEDVSKKSQGVGLSIVGGHLEKISSGIFDQNRKQIGEMM